MLTTYALAELLVKAGDDGLTAPAIASCFDGPGTRQQRSSWASQILRRMSGNGYARRGEREPATPGAGAPAFRWYATPWAAEYLADGSRAERARRAAERRRRVALITVQQREAALAAVRQELGERFGAGGEPAKCWRSRKIRELRQVPCSLQEIGDIFGLTRERVRQIEAGCESPCRCTACAGSAAKST